MTLLPAVHKIFKIPRDITLLDVFAVQNTFIDKQVLLRCSELGLWIEDLDLSILRLTCFCCVPICTSHSQGETRQFKILAIYLQSPALKTAAAPFSCRGSESKPAPYSSIWAPEVFMSGTLPFPNRSSRGCERILPSKSLPDRDHSCSPKKTCTDQQAS